MIDTKLQKRINKILPRFPWYAQIVMWHCEHHYVSEQEIRDGVEYLEKLK